MKKLILATAMVLMAVPALAQPVTPADFDQLSGDMRCQAGSFTVMDGGQIKFCHRDVFCNVTCL